MMGDKWLYIIAEWLPLTQIFSKGVMATLSARRGFHLSGVVLFPLIDCGGSAAQFFELDSRSPWYIKLSDSSALVPVCIAGSLSLWLSAWRGTVNDVFVLRSAFVLSWFLEQHKQAWNLFCPPRKKKEKNGRHPSLSVHNSAPCMRGSESDLCFAAPL